VKLTATVFHERSTELERTVQSLGGARSTEQKVPGVAYSRGPGVGSTPGYSVLFLTLITSIVRKTCLLAESGDEKANIPDRLRLRVDRW